MAIQQDGYTYVDCATYDEFRTYALTHGVNVDGMYGNQCWDICALLWYQYGLTLQTGGQDAKGCWLVKKAENAVPPFSAIENLSEVKRGDVVVFDGHGGYPTGHIAFADEDYQGGGQIKIVGQNQGQGSASGTPSNIVNWSTSYFLGAFRNSNWHQTPPTPTSAKRTHFPWVLYARKLRNRNIYF